MFGSKLHLLGVSVARSPGDAASYVAPSRDNFATEDDVMYARVSACVHPPCAAHVSALEPRGLNGLLTFDTVINVGRAATASPNRCPTS